MIKRTNIKIGLIGEDPNDTNAIANLLKQKHNDGFSYVTISQHKRGGQILNPTSVKSYNIEIKSKLPDYVIVIMDADLTIHDEEKIQKKKDKFYRNFETLSCKNKLLLMNVYELEALIVADIDSCNKYYKSNITYSGNVMYLNDPKKFLMDKTLKGKQYHVSHCPDLFKTLQFDTIIKNVPISKSSLLKSKRPYLAKLNKITTKKDNRTRHALPHPIVQISKPLNNIN